MIKRTITQSLEGHLAEKEMTIIIGPRQVGKTYLMKYLEGKLKAKGEKTLFLNLDIDDHRPFFDSQGHLISYIELQVGKEKAYVFIDEIQRKENAELFLKGIADMDLPYKFIISGSGSLELKAKISESMAGRKRMFAIDPISLKEFINFRTEYRYEDRLGEFFALEKDKTERFLEEYMVFGGYPQVILSDTAWKKQSAMEEIYKSYIEQDIKKLLNIEKEEAFTNLIKVIASQIGSLVNNTELSSTIGIADKTVQHYLWYLEKTFIIKKVSPYYRNVRSEISKSPIYYFYDVGLRNFLLGLFGLPRIPQPLSGHLFENLIFNMLREQFDMSPTQIHFWRTRDRAEIDFIIATGLEAVPLEAKHKRLRKLEVPRSFRSFLKKYKPKKAYLIHLGDEQEIVIDKTKIYALPFYAFLEHLKLKSLNAINLS